jgi:hypothetical protein
MTQPQDANELLMSGGVKSCKFETLGDTWIGTIADQPKATQMTKYQSTTGELDYWPSGDPKMQIVVTIATDVRDPALADDDGRRRLFIPPRMMTPVREAVQRAGAKGLAIGGRIAVKWISGLGKGEGDPKVYAADYAAPVVDPGNLLAGGNGQPGAAAAALTAPVLSTATGQPVVHHQQVPVATAPDLGAAPAPAAAPPASGGLLNQTPVAQAGPPPGVEPAVWNTLPDAQRQAILAAMASPAAAFTPQTPF